MPKFSVKKPLTVFVVVIIIISLGIVSLLKMTPDLLPNIDLPYVVIMTTNPGSTPEEIEKNISKPLEKSLATVEDIKKIQSVSSPNYSMIILEFENGVNMDTAIVNTLQSVDAVEGTWDESVGSPYIMKLNPSMLPIAVTAVNVKGMSPEEISYFVENTLSSDLEGVTGVANITNAGLIESKVNVSINDEKIERLNEKLLGEASPSMASAKKKLNSGLSQIRKAEAKLKSSRKELDEKKNQTFDQLAKTSAQLDAAVAKAGAVSTQITVLEGRAEAIEAQISQGIYGEAAGITLQELQSQLKDVKSQLAMLQMDSQKANEQVDKLQEAYEQAERGTYTAQEGFDEAYAKLDTTQKQLTSQKSELNSAIKQLDEAGNQSLQAAGLDSMITMDMVSNILQGQNFSMPAGYIQTEKARYLISVGDKLTDLDQVEDLFLFDIEGLGDVKLNDVADVFIADNSDSVYASINGNPGVLLAFFKQSNYPTATVSGNINEKLEELSEKYDDIEFTSLMDQGQYIYLIINSILSSLGFGALFAIVVLLLFLRDIKPTFITLLSIPISITFAIVLMYFSGITINLISLSGLAVAVGMLVDNSIVVIENIFRLRRMGISSKKAAVAGAKEVAAAITSSTLTTVCVFAPIIFVSGITRQLFTDMALTITFSLLASLIIALSLVPSLASVLLTRNVKPEGKHFSSFIAGYKKILSWNLKHKSIVILLSIALLGISVYGSISRGFIFIPDMSTPQLSGMMVMNDENASVSETKKMADEVMSRMSKVEGVKSSGAMLASEGLLSTDTSSNTVTLYVMVDQEKDLSGGEIAQNIENACKGLDCEITINSSSSMNSYSSALGNEGIGINVFGTDTNQLQKAAKTIGNVLESIPGTTEVDNGLIDAEPEFHFIIDKEKAMENGLTIAQVYMQVSKALTYEKSSARMLFDNKEYDIVVTDGDEKSVSLKDLKDLELEGTLSDGQKKSVQLREISTVERTQTLPSISRIDQRTYINVSAQIEENHNVTLLTAEAQKALDKVKLPAGITYEFSGENETIMDSMEDLLKMMGLGILLVYLIMVAQFQSLKSPFIVMFTIPLAFTGGLLALLLFGKELSVIAMIGLILLVGVVVNNGIVLVDYINQLRGRGLTKREAILEAGATRMRPVLMTSLTTILGLVVLAIGKTAGTDMMQPVALVCIGGLAYATALTLLVVPVMYDIFNGEKYRAVKEEDIDISDIIIR